MDNLTEKITEFLLHNGQKTNAEIARTLLMDEAFNDYTKSPDSLRRRISNIRRANKIPPPDEPRILIDTIDETDTTRNITKTLYRQITSLDDLIRECKIDLTEWDIERWVCNKWDMGYKNTVTMTAHTIPLFQVKVWLIKNKPKQNLLELKNEIIEEIKKHKPNYKDVKYSNKSQFVYEICPFDIHFGKLTWGEETNFDYDISIAEKDVLKCVAEHLSYAKSFNVERFLFPVGNDFFNSDNKNNTTTNGTPQDEDTRWRKTYKRGRQLLIKCVDMLREFAPVDVIVVPGNHDLERSFYLGDSLECWYNNIKGVAVDNSPRVRKYYEYGNCLIGFAHGKDEKVSDLPTIMAIETPELFGKCKFREWHLGDKHHSKKIDTISIDENKGVTTRIMRSISPADNWHFNKGYIGSLRTMEGFLWDKERGLKAQFNADLIQKNDQLQKITQVR